MVGTRGIPARYGGFETAIEEISLRMVAQGWEVTVYCRSHDHRQAIGGVRRIELPHAKLRWGETLSHSALSVGHVLLRNRPDVVFLFNAANAWLEPFLRLAGIRVILHPDGLEWKRTKWSRVGRTFYRLAERLALQLPCDVIADAKALQDYYLAEYGRPSHYVPYGAYLVEASGSDHLALAGVEKSKYHLVVARLEPENQVHTIVAAYAASKARYPMVVVGSAPYSNDYEKSIRLAARDADVRFLGGIWNQDLLNNLYSDSLTYYHGHSVGGTNPSLLRAMGAGSRIVAHDNAFNREVLQDAGVFFTNSSDLKQLISAAEHADPDDRSAIRLRVRSIISESYDWDRVTDRYMALARAQISSPLRHNQ